MQALGFGAWGMGVLARRSKREGAAARRVLSDASLESSAQKLKSSNNRGPAPYQKSNQKQDFNMHWRIESRNFGVHRGGGGCCY